MTTPDKSRRLGLPALLLGVCALYVLFRSLRPFDAAAVTLGCCGAAILVKAAFAAKSVQRSTQLRLGIVLLALAVWFSLLLA